MKNSFLLHKSSTKMIVIKYIIALLPLLLYGIYKNSIILLLSDTSNIITALKPFLLPILGFFSGILIFYIKNKSFELNFYALEGLIIGMIMPISINIIIFLIAIPILMYLLSFTDNKIDINKVAIIKLCIILILVLMHKYNYANSIEQSGVYAYSFVDMIFGRQIGGVASSSLICIIAGFCFLLTDYYYKKEIPIIAMITYIIFTLLSLIFLKDFSLILRYLISSSAFFTFIFIAPLSKYSAYTKKGQIISGIIIGILTVILNMLGFIYESAVISVLITNIFVFIFNRLKITKIYKK